MGRKKYNESENENNNNDGYESESDNEPIKALDEEDIAVLQTYSSGPYTAQIKKTEASIADLTKAINKLVGVREVDTGLAPPNEWDIEGDIRVLATEQPLIVGRCSTIIPPINQAGGDNQNNNSNSTASILRGDLGLGGAGSTIADPDSDYKYVVSLSTTHMKFVVGLGKRVSPTDVEEGMRVGLGKTRYSIEVPLPPPIDASVTMMTVEEKPDVTYNDVGGAKDQIKSIREVVEIPLLEPEKYLRLGIDPPKGVMLYGPPGTGKTLLARAIANRTDATFIRVIGSELVQRYTGEGARMVRELFQMARMRRACVIFFDEVDAIGGTRFDGDGAENEVQRTMLELINQLDGFDPRGNIKVIMATNRPDTLDPALTRPGRIDRKIEIGLPDLEGRAQIFKIHSKHMNVASDIRFDLLSRLCPSSTGADIHSVCTEAGMYAIRARRKIVTEKDFLNAIEKVIKGYQKFSATPKYLAYN